jgi:thioredoxin 1
MKVLKFYAEWCGPCKALTATINEHYNGDVPIEEINIDTNIDAAIKYQIRSVPTCVLLDDSGNEIGRKVGVMTAEQFEDFVKGVK